MNLWRLLERQELRVEREIDPIIFTGALSTVEDRLSALESSARYLSLLTSTFTRRLSSTLPTDTLLSATFQFPYSTLPRSGSQSGDFAMSAKSFTERELELIKLALQCVENPKLDVAKYQALGGFATLGSARASWWNLKVKLGVNTSRPGAANAEDSTNNSAPAAAETPKNRKRKLATSPADDSPTSIKKRTKQVSKSVRAKEPGETQIKQEASPQALSEGNGSPQ